MRARCTLRAVWDDINRCIPRGRFCPTGFMIDTIYSYAATPTPRAEPSYPRSPKCRQNAQEKSHPPPRPDAAAARWTRAEPRQFRALAARESTAFGRLEVSRWQTATNSKGGAPATSPRRQLTCQRGITADRQRYRLLSTHTDASHPVAFQGSGIPSRSQPHIRASRTSQAVVRRLGAQGRASVLLRRLLDGLALLGRRRARRLV